MFRSYYIGNPLVSTVSISSASSARAGGGGNVLVSERKSQQESVGEEIIHYHRGMDGVCIFLQQSNLFFATYNWVLYIFLFLLQRYNNILEKPRYWAKIYNKLSTFARYRAFSLYIGSIQYNIRERATFFFSRCKVTKSGNPFWP